MCFNFTGGPSSTAIVANVALDVNESARCQAVILSKEEFCQCQIMARPEIVSEDGYKPLPMKGWKSVAVDQETVGPSARH